MNNQQDQTQIAWNLIKKTLDDTIKKGGYGLSESAQLFQAIIIIEQKLKHTEDKQMGHTGTTI